MKSKLTLKVAESLQDDAYKGIARIDESVMKELKIKRGDVILIGGEKKTVAIVDKSYSADIGQGIIRIDGILRRNSKSGIGDLVYISPVEIKEAKQITIAPAQKGIMVQGDPEKLKRGLLGRAVVKGDIVILGGVQRREDLLSEDYGELNDMFGDIFENMGFGKNSGGIAQIKFEVVSLNPNVPAIITENTEVSLNSKAVEVFRSLEEIIPEKKVIEISNMPNLNEYIRVKDIENFLKVVNSVNFVNRFQDKEKTVYTVLNYFIEVRNKKKEKNKKSN